MRRENPGSSRWRAGKITAGLLLTCGLFGAHGNANAGTDKPAILSRGEEFVPALSFEPNQGQAVEGVKFLARSAGYTLFLTPLEVVITFEHSAVRAPSLRRPDSLVMTLVGGNSESHATARHELPGRSSYLVGRNPQKWWTGIPTFEWVQFANIYPGIDVSYRGPQGRLEYEFSVLPNSEPAQIAIEINGGNALYVRGGRLVVRTPDRELQFDQATAYQETASGRQYVSAKYRLLNPHRVGFVLGTYDRTKPLFIGPVLRYVESASSRRN